VVGRRKRIAAAVLVLVSLGSVTGAVVSPGPAHAQTAQAVADPSGEFTPVTPARILDTRTGLGGGGGPLGPGAVRSLQVAGVGGIPSAGVAAVVLNVTVADATALSHLTIWPEGGTFPVASNLNFSAGSTVPNLVTVKVGANGRVDIFNNAGSTQVVADVFGWYASPTGVQGSRFHETVPARILDTRNGQGPLGPGETRALQVTGVGGVPATNVTAIAINVTATSPTAGSFLTVFPGDVARPDSSNLNFDAGVTVPNLVVVRVPASGVIDIFNYAGAAHVLVDVAGWYDNDRSSESGRFVPLSPTRVLDTRTSGSPIGPVSVRTVQITGTGGVPVGGARAVVANLTVTQPTMRSYMTAYPSGQARPNASTLNFVAGQTVPNLAMVGLSGSGAIDVYNNEGSAHLIVDVAGYFTSVAFGFDTCEAPSVSSMAAWRSASPYTVIGVYIGGGMRACANTAFLSTAWVDQVTAMGWRLIPIYVGLQATCTTFRYRIDPGSAFGQGQLNADDAANRAAAAGVTAGAPIYFDMEGYDNSDPVCSEAVKSFISGWVTELHARGYRAGLYSSLSSGIADQTAAVREGRPPVDAVWVAAWNDTPNLFGFTPPSALPDSFWVAHQRIHQYQGGHDETWGGVTINIDTNVIDGPVFP
jgi:hypothetical protein